MVGAVVGRRRRRQEVAGGHNGNFAVRGGKLMSTTHNRVMRAGENGAVE